MKSCNKTNVDIKNIKMYFEIEGKNLTFLWQTDQYYFSFIKITVIYVWTKCFSLQVNACVAKPSEKSSEISKIYKRLVTKNSDI